MLRVVRSASSYSVQWWHFLLLPCLAVSYNCRVIPRVWVNALRWAIAGVVVSLLIPVRVENVRCEPEPTESVEERPGVRRWKLVLPAGGKQQIVTSYRVRHPLDMRVEGL